MSDDRKKKLEELRKRKAALKKLVGESAATTESPSPAIPNPTIDSSSRMETSTSDSTTSSRPISLNPSFTSSANKRNSIKNQIIYDIQMKKINESLRSSKSEHCIQGIKKERKTEETQYILPEESEEKKKQEEMLNLQVEKLKKNSNMNQKKKKLKIRKKL